METATHNVQPSTRPRVWYLAAGYAWPGGIEAHILHYAREMRNHGFDTDVVGKDLPLEHNRFLGGRTQTGSIA